MLCFEDNIQDDRKVKILRCRVHVGRRHGRRGRRLRCLIVVGDGDVTVTREFTLRGLRGADEVSAP